MVKKSEQMRGSLAKLTQQIKNIEHALRSRRQRDRLAVLKRSRRLAGTAVLSALGNWETLLKLPGVRLSEKDRAWLIAAGELTATASENPEAVATLEAERPSAGPKTMLAIGASAVGGLGIGLLVGSLFAQSIL
jgi:hypothetical protein